jgi:hypothetical protein
LLELPRPINLAELPTAASGRDLQQELLDPLKLVTRTHVFSVREIRRVLTCTLDVNDIRESRTGEMAAIYIAWPTYT